jgi:plasmid segregation protein ParM
VILVGGGAHLFKKAVKQAFPQLRVLGIKDPLHSNVRGFQIAGMAYMQRQSSPQGTSRDGQQGPEGAP